MSHFKCASVILLVGIAATLAIRPAHAGGPKFEIFVMPASEAGIPKFTGTTLPAEWRHPAHCWIDGSKIEKYSWREHTIFITEDSAGLLDDYRSPMGIGGRAFAMVVNGEVVYWGRFDWIASSSLQSVPMLHAIGKEDRFIRIGPPQISGRPDPRSDEKIRLCLAELGLLDE